jgi:hypothetical protein
MENLIIEKKRNTPLIEFNTNGELKIEGRLIPENSAEFFENLLNWLNEYISTKPQKTTLQVNLEYFNSSSGILLIKIFRLLEQLTQSGLETVVYWHHPCDDPDMLEAGRHFEMIAKLPFRYNQLVN